MIVTIDGPAGAGKSTVSRRLAERLGFEFLDTGAMYRAVVLAALRRGHDWNQAAQLVEFAKGLSIQTTKTGVVLDGEDVSVAIRTQEITSLTKYSADNPGVRAIMVERQRAAAAGRNIVTEGRDQGSVVFPDAECKIFLTASPEERARRRQADLTGRGERVTFEQVLAEQSQRDMRDTRREVGPLVQPDDAVVLWTDGLDEPQVVDALVQIVEERCRTLGIELPGA